MPTGYTAKLYEGEDVSFKDFLLGCAHAFNFRMRDLPIGSEIPEPEMDEWYTKSVERDKEWLARSVDLTTEEAERAAAEEYVAALEAHVEAERKRLDHVRQYREMVVQVEAWTPPTDKHQALKDFMLQQLEVTYQYDLAPSSREIKLLSGEEYRAQQIQAAKRSLDYSTEAFEERLASFHEGVIWVHELTKSIEAL